ncbi:MAG: DUF3159 domain-containing protein [Chloroflexi bacterium]|nr:MAG: DUF3159 domain-containing protein [Chloroflexota bacterium]MBL1193217.1 DUF3159 domain-containing protein [Chloroflexota bacterium]NOH10511.1 DUF3159 domain-containing protein [Chloroflexota bacterium]
MGRARELREEFFSVFSGRGSRLLDSFLPLLIFLIANALFGVELALWGALIVAGLFALYRIVKKASLVYALGGLGGVVLAAIFMRLSGSEAGFFLPGLISGSVTVVLCVVTVAVNRPLVAWTSFATRRWPLGWYWHPKVLPAYNEVTILWAVAFAARLSIELWLFNREAVNALGVIRLLLGWPFLVVLLIATYLYGLWRLGKLQGPSVEEFKAGKEAPWEGQRRGF